MPSLDAITIYCFKDCPLTSELKSFALDHTGGGFTRRRCEGTGAPLPSAGKRGTRKDAMNQLASLTRKASILTISLLWGVIATGQNISITIDPVTVHQQGTITFAQFPAGQVPNLPQDIG